MKNDLKHTISELAETVLEDSELFLVDVEVKGARGAQEVWVYVDAEEGGVNLDECADISNELGFLLEAHEVFATKYRLNVSSPGLSRPLSDRRQYPKNRGRKTRIKYKKDGEYLKVEGILREVTEAAIRVENEETGELFIPFENIVETKILPSI